MHARKGRGHGCGCRLYTQQQQHKWINWNGLTWNYPVVPYPTAPPRHHFCSLENNILCPSPANAYVASKFSYTPTNTEQALHTMTLNLNPNWYLDTWSTNDMSNTTCKFSTYVNTNGPNDLVIGNGLHILIHGYGHTTLQPSFPPPKHSYIFFMLLTELKTFCPSVALQLVIPLLLNLNLFVVLWRITRRKFLSYNVIEPDIYTLFHYQMHKLPVLPHLLLCHRIFSIIARDILDHLCYVFYIKTILFIFVPFPISIFVCLVYLENISSYHCMLLHRLHLYLFICS